MLHAVKRFFKWDEHPRLMKGVVYAIFVLTVAFAVSGPALAEPVRSHVLRGLTIPLGLLNIWYMLWLRANP